MKCVFIANSQASSDRYRAAAETACRKIGAECKFILPERGSDLTELARTAAEECGADKLRMIILGGDGMICRIATGIANMPNVELGCIPCGSGNDYVRTFGGAKKFMDFEAALTAPSKYVDGIRADGLISLNICSMGLDAMICDRTNRMTHIKKILKSGTYSLAALISIFGRVYNSLRVTIDDKYVYEGDFVFSLAASGQYYGGGYRGAPLANPHDGLLDFILVRRVSKLRIASLIGDYKKGLHMNNPEFEDILIARRGKKMKLESSSPAVITVDGECSSVTEMTFEIVPQAVRFIIPE